MYKSPDQATLVWIQKDGDVFVGYDTLWDDFVGQIKRLDFRIHYLKDWQPLKNYFNDENN